MQVKIAKRWNGSAWVPVVVGSAGVQEEVFASSGTWLCPGGVHQIQVECWGGGGGGGGRGGSQGGSGGGGGGAYARKIVSVTPGQSYSYVVGAAGAGGGPTSTIVNADPGGNSVWGADIVKAEGGKGGFGTVVTGTVLGGAGGQAANSIGDVVFSGGNGGNSDNGSVILPGGGGGGAGSTENGQNGGTQTGIGGAGGVVGGGAGGTWTSTSNGASPGSAIGGGGSGARRSSGGVSGAAGAAGQIKITYSFAVTPSKVHDYLLEEQFTASGNWTAPSNVDEVQVECWGGGGGGGGSTVTGGGPGGGGGAYARKKVAVTPGASHAYTVGGGGASSTVNGSDGGDTFWTDGSQVKAVGGKGSIRVNNLPGAAGGQAANCIGTTKFSGGNGGSSDTGSGARAGGGGGGAGSTQNGSNGTSAGIGGSGGIELGGAGGTKSNLDTNGNAPGNVPGGGGSGARSNTGQDIVGGVGGAGLIRIRYGTTWLPELNLVLAKATTEGFGHPSIKLQIGLNQFIHWLKIKNIWNLADLIHVLVTDNDANFTRINLKNPNNFLGEIVGDLTFVSKGGFVGTAGGYFNHKWMPTNGVQYTQNSASVFLDGEIPAGVTMGSFTAGGGIIWRDFSGNDLAGLNSGNGGLGTNVFTQGGSTKTYYLERTIPTGISYAVEGGTKVAVGSNNSSTVQPVEIVTCGSNSSGTKAGIIGSKSKLLVIGGPLNHADLNTGWKAFLNYIA